MDGVYSSRVYSPLVNYVNARPTLINSVLPWPSPNTVMEVLFTAKKSFSAFSYRPWFI